MGGWRDKRSHLMRSITKNEENPRATEKRNSEKPLKENQQERGEEKGWRQEGERR